MRNHRVIYYISPGQLGTTAYITRAVALIYVIGGLQIHLHVHNIYNSNIVYLGTVFVRSDAALELSPHFQLS